MKELSLNILDIVQNSIAAGAEHIGIALIEDADGKLKMTADKAKRVVAEHLKGGKPVEEYVIGNK